MSGGVTGVQFADGFDGPDTIALGLGAPQLATVVAGGLGGYGLIHAGGPAALRLPLAAALVAVAAALGWGRLADRPLLDWCLLAARFGLRPRRGGDPLLAAGGDGDDGEPPWARWLRQGGARRDGSVAGAGDDPGEEDGGVEAEAGDANRGVEPAAIDDPGGPEAWTSPPAPPPNRVGDGSADLRPAPAGAAPPPGPAAGARQAAPARRLRDRWQRRAGRTHPPEPASDAPVAGPPTVPVGKPAPPPLPGRTVELDRPSIVLLPEPLGAADDGADPGDDPDLESGEDADRDPFTGEGDEPGAALPALLRLPRLDDDGEGLAVADVAAEIAPPALAAGGTPVFVGATRRITFFSLNGGSGRTTLATEVACLLAARGAHRPTAETPPQPLSVALLDLDLRSANVAMRLGIPQPTILDYLLDGGEEPAAVRRYLVRHPSGLRALLGPPKPLGQSGGGLEPARVAEIIHQLERDGAHFIVIDVGADLGAVTTWVLTAVHDIYVVIRPTASGIQDAYRSTEALRRLGLGHKLRYVVNRARGALDVGEVMGDLGGRVVATIPDDPRVEEAENRHRQVGVDGHGPAAAAIARLAAEVYPGLAAGSRRGRLSRLRRRRVG